MRILYSGWFLKEGFQQLGCEVVPFKLNSEKTFDQLVEESGCSPDLIFVELLGNTPIPKQIHSTRHTLAAYCVDSSINQFWLTPLMRLFHHVYVDQLHSVAHFKKHSVQATWLPLCANTSDFREERAKTHLLTFVGRITGEREKRSNLLKHISKHFDIHCVHDISHQDMLDLYASSHAVLNENFFPSLNLRFFLALAAGTLLLTECRSPGVSHFFTAGTHHLEYDHDTILRTLESIHNAPESFREVAKRGQDACWKEHRSIHRAEVVLKDAHSRTIFPALPADVAMVCEAHAKYNFARRFGGSLQEAVTLLHGIDDCSADVAAYAEHFKGCIALRHFNNERGFQNLERSASHPTINGLLSAMLLCLHQVRSGNKPTSLTRVINILGTLNVSITRHHERIRSALVCIDSITHCCLLFSSILIDLGYPFEPGFLKQYLESQPEYALEYAIFAFNAQKSCEALDLIIRCTAMVGLATEALPYIKDAILAGVATDEHIALSASLALQCFDYAYAEVAANAD